MAIVVVAIIVAGLGYAFVTGLAYQYIKKVQENLESFDIQEPPPPPEEVPPPPPPDTPVPPPPTTIVTPPARVQVPMPTPPMPTTPIIPPSQPITPPTPPRPVSTPVPPPRPTPPPTPTVNKSAKPKPKSNPGNWFPQSDYPSAAKRANAQGTVSVRLTIGTDGRVADCQVTGNSSGNSALADVTCRNARSRGRFEPAKNAAGQPIQSVYSLPVRWELRDE